MKDTLLRKISTLLRWRLISTLIDLCAIVAAWYGSYWLRFNLGVIPKQEFLHASYLLPFLMLVQSLVSWLLGLDRGIWRFASLSDLMRILKVVLVGAIISLAGLFFVPFSIPRSIIPIYVWLSVSILGGARLFYRWLKNYRGGFKEGKKALIVGAGQVAELLLRELTRDHYFNDYNVVAMIDDDLLKKGCEIHGIRVIGNLDDIPMVVDKYEVELIIIAISSAKSEIINKIIDCCKKLKIESRIVPSLHGFFSGSAAINTLREISVEDLLGRNEVNSDWDKIARMINGKKIIVSGGGGSIGSELCRQIAYLAPSLLVVIDNSEYNLYTIDKELREKFPQLQLITLLIDITDYISVQNIMKQYSLDIVFHAAAYKHVPLLEYQVRAAMRNNILGTFNIAKASVDNEIKTFVLISTDKAVNPANIMGATKRAAEIICQNMNESNTTSFITVRFGNVLGSSGSVIPLFKEQLINGKDLTVTHPDVTRYFMTIPEATQLILQATILGKSGEILVLDMGKPVKIKELAEQIIYLSGKKIGKNINIKYIGLRSGEKLYEELFYNSEELLSTSHVKIKHAKYQVLDRKITPHHIDRLQAMFDANESEEKFKELLIQMVPEYKA
ncbi:MAG: polysaccharide biosynthesis protein [Coxiellaceae bacterium]|jgi:FlaA1/EpsC-like NDP-sugar epimerase|nr:polysaccharide biosynthesis protein [Coxiellaceae bacterium]